MYFKGISCRFIAGMPITADCVIMANHAAVAHKALCDLPYQVNSQGAYLTPRLCMLAWGKDL